MSSSSQPPDLESVATKHGFSEAAVRSAFDALQHANGRQAQFNHRDLGGMGQWSSGGMLMIGDMFNHGLKARVADLFQDLAPLAFGGTGTPHNAALQDRWPAELGSPSSSGSQNSMHYAVFPETRRLAIEQNGKVTIYDTGDRRISGVSQQQSGAQDLTFSGPDGPVSVTDLPVVDDHSSPAATPAMNVPAATDDDDVTRKIGRLHDLFVKGGLTQDEYNQAKAKLLDSL
jgi:hypothetical protein